MKRAERAIENHKQFMSCSAAVLCAFREDAGLSEEEARQLAAQYAGGRMGTCGAVLAAKTVLIRKFGEDDPRAALLEEQFTEMNRSALCRELKGGLTGRPLRSCRGCVTDAAELLEKLLDDAGQPAHNR
ncbi:MAG: C_GCAxxG_C_C family protein [Oscillospiraceae bacterium]|nr:C_GCAxxG_C_C family protein [Oscillospiraceae bacterium]